MKKISEKLELLPVGFVVTPEAIGHYLKVTEGVPPTIILINLSVKTLVLTLIRLGKNFPSQFVSRSQNLGEDVVEGLSRYRAKEAFPARVLIYNGKEGLESIKQELTAFPWQEDSVGKKGISFLHLPRIEVLPVEFDIRAVALAGGKEVAQAAGFQAEIATKKAQENDLSSGDKQSKTTGAVGLGFVEGQDIKEVDNLSTVSDRDGQISGDLSLKVGNGVVVKKDIGSKSSRSGFWAWFKKCFGKLKMLKLPKKLFKGNLKFSGSRKLPLVFSLVFGLLLVIGGGLSLAYWRLPKAVVTIFLEPKALEEEFEIILDPSLSEVDVQNLILPARVVEVELDEKASRETSETKLVGEKATGEVTVYNGTSQEKEFEAGTIIASSSGLEFTFNEAVTVASQSGTAADPTPGKATVEITAVEIGSEGNLAADTEFGVANYSQSDYVAKNSSAFAGGTSREVQVVASEDHSRLLEDLTVNLEKESVQRLESEVSSGKKLLEESIKSEVIKEDYSHDVGEEVSQVSLELGLKLSGLEYSEELMRQLIEQVVKDKVPAGFEFRSEESRASFEPEEITQDGRAVFKAKLSVNLIPQLDLEQIRVNLVGKQPQFGKTYLDNLPGVMGTEILISPELPSRLMTFPRLVDNIQVSTKVR